MPRVRSNGKSMGQRSQDCRLRSEYSAFNSRNTGLRITHSGSSQISSFRV